MCCGQKRTDLRNSQAHNTARSLRQTFAANRSALAVRTHPSAPATTPTSSSRWPLDAQSIRPDAQAVSSPPTSSIGVRYLENSPIRVRGLVSGMSYEFSGAAPIRQVDARDAPTLLNTRFFQRA
jgi:hypothetical protein